MICSLFVQNVKYKCGRFKCYLFPRKFNGVLFVLEMFPELCIYLNKQLYAFTRTEKDNQLFFFYFVE